MSMQNYPGSGHLAKFHKFDTFLGQYMTKNKFSTLENDLVGNDDAAIAKINKIFKKHKFPEIVGCVIFSEEDDIDDDLERNELYLIYDEDKLFVRTPTPAMKAIKKKLDIEPKFTNYSQWG